MNGSWIRCRRIRNSRCWTSEPGAGVIGITLALERPKWQVTLSDISAAALKIALTNQRLHGTNLNQVESDLFARLGDQRFDLIVTNPRTSR